AADDRGLDEAEAAEGGAAGGGQQVGNGAHAPRPLRLGGRLPAPRACLRHFAFHAADEHGIGGPCPSMLPKRFYVGMLWISAAFPGGPKPARRPTPIASG